MENRPISSQQLSAMIFLLLIGSALVYVPGKAAGQSAWIANILGSCFGLYILFALLRLQQIYPGQRITQLSVSLLGRIPGTLLNIAFFWSIFIYASTMLYETVLLLTIIYPAVLDILLFFIIILVSVYCVYQGLNIMGRLGELFVWLSLFFIFIGIMIAFPLVEVSKLKPVVESWRSLAAASIYVADWPFDVTVIWGLFLPLVSSIRDNQKKIYAWYFISVLVLTASTFLTLAILGPDLIANSRFPLFEIYRLVGFGEFRRLELTFLALWLTAGITSIIIMYQGITFITQDIFRLKDYRALILPIGLLLAVLTLYMFPTDVFYQALGFKYIPAYTFPVNLLYPTLLLIAAEIKRKKTGTKRVQGSGSALRGKGGLPGTEGR